MACTSFFMDHAKQPVFGENLDWPTGEGLVVINKRGFYKTAMTDPKKSLNPIGWKSVYGSVTFNMHGCDWPWGGMNEAGLVCGTMQLKETRYPAPDLRPSIFMTQWLQYQLDNYSTVSEVLASSSKLRIRPIRKKRGTHFFVSDQSGDCAVIEFLDGKFVFYHQKSLPIKVLTNDPYEVLLNIANKFDSFSSKHSIPEGNLSYIRFLKAASMLHNHKADNLKSLIGHAFNILGTVAYKNHRTTHTQWSIVYDIKNRLIYFRTKKNSEIRFVDMKAINFACSTPVKMIDINNSMTGDVTHKFEFYTYPVNRAMFEKAFMKNPMKVKFHEERLDRISRYPETFNCQQ